MSIRSKGISTAIAFAMTGAMFGIGTQAAYAAPADVRAGADEICTVMGIGSGAAGLTKALAKGASVVGIGASVGCYLYSQAKNATPEQKRAAMTKSYREYQAKSDLKKLEALGYSCRKKNSGGGGGGDIAPADVTVKVGFRDIKMKGVTYKCSAIGD
ncbi:hypothetical protein [Streptomyces capitiformicae]|uniref:Secreted protein n=1 Tax=Streptomyces capitiformicae TaxID=2014920 RepID=A0A918ZA50_9ACTN|nr:hypothetical protein [Streptomyces capitiformicae]GHE42803.1 hypothetical protein GCM10017771_62520 [Streptomyces capitiformicae]